MSSPIVSTSIIQNIPMTSETNHVEKQSTMIDKNITEEKYKQLKRKLKAMMEVNETISKEYSQAKRKVRLLMMERK
ncbi:hypothetical protein BDC45DRAFT_500695 [Circinella umbellata]|nr:hypothetical protein BDC45DRAFT_500695 [Circinella umbellata]